ncbi:GNAT family N-acetyltransferase [Blautia sp. MSJ-19]|uniref:GNAT family N-acetyltransferase n=1 Tax=Blautia sp. MSJ-19 TaxID=2841517 RepID=UPI001C0E9900|nr:GNAT family N-acetyltransferase [Blautia sp. MSJ-19]
MSEAIEFKSTISTKEFCQLRESVGFQKLTVEQAETVLFNTSLLVNAVNDGRSVGIVRVLTDFVTDAYITDMIVSPDFQGKGLGKQLVNKALECLKDHSVEEVKLACSLYANPGKEAFYAKFGFQELPNDKYGYGMLAEL